VRRHLLGLRQEGLDPAQIQQRVARVALLDDAGHDVALAPGVLLVLEVPLGLADPLGHDLPGGLLVYAKGEADSAEYEVRHAGKRLEVTALDLDGPLDDVLASVRRLAQRVLALRNQARQLNRAA